MKPKTISLRRLASVGAAVLASAAIATCLSACGGGSKLASVPRCKPHSEGCRETSNSGDWVPLVYWYILLNQQNLSATQIPSYQSSVPSSVAPSSSGVSSDELEEPSENSSGDNESDSSDDNNSAGDDENSSGSDDESDDSGDDDFSSGGGGDDE